MTMTRYERELAAFSEYRREPPKRGAGQRCGTCRYGSGAGEPEYAWCLQYPEPRLMWEHSWCSRWRGEDG